MRSASPRTVARLPVLALAAVAGLGAAAAARAEVRAERHPTRGWQVVIEAVDGRTWTPVLERAFDPHVLEPLGDSNGLGRPAVGVRPAVGLGEAVFARPGGGGGIELAFARHDGGRWMSAQRVLSEPANAHLSPRLAHDDHGRSVVAWHALGLDPHSTVAGLSLDGRPWGPVRVEDAGHRVAGLASDGEDYYLATVQLADDALLRLRRVAFPFPDGGPALPFPDESMRVEVVTEEALCPNGERPMSSGDGPLPRPGGVEPEAALALIDIRLVRTTRNAILVDWPTPKQALRWVAVEAGEVLERGEEPYNSPSHLASLRKGLERRFGR